MLRVVSQNLNGIRSAARKGWFPWAATLGADAICVQEVRAQLSDMDDTMQLSPNDVVTVVTGMAASMGQFLLTAGTIGKRYATPNARLSWSADWMTTRPRVGTRT